MIDPTAAAISRVTDPTGVSAARYYWPRWQLDLAVPLPGDSLEVERFTVPVRRFELISNPHNEADELIAVTDWHYAGVEPRLIESAIGTFYVGQADEDGSWSPNENDVQFIGVMKRPKRFGDGEEGLVVEMLFHDYTTLFLETKGKFPAEGVPEYSETLSAAWRRICEHTGSVNPDDPSELLPTVKDLADRIVFVGGASDVTIGSAVPARFRNFGRVQVPPKADAWAVWQQCVGMLGLISFIRKDQCFVATATDYFTSLAPPRLIWGHNIKSITEDRDANIAGKGILITSFDSLTGTVLEGFYPPIGDTSVRKKKVSAKHAADTNAVLRAEDREAFAFPGIGTQEAIDRFARRVYEEFSRQEYEGRAVTSDLTGLRIDGSEFDFLSLRDGDAIRIEVSRDDYDALGQFSGDDEKIAYLVDRQGYDASVAKIVVRNLTGLLALPPVFICKRVHLRGETTPEGGEFAFEITFVNRIQVDGGAT